MCASMCVSVLVFTCMPCICLPLCGFLCVLENLSKSSPLKSLLWHIISPRYKGNLSKLKLKGKERGGGLGIGVVGEIPVSSENISCPRVLVAAAGVLTHQDPSTPCFSLSLSLSFSHTHTYSHPHRQTQTHVLDGEAQTHRMSDLRHKRICKPTHMRMAQ